MAELNKRNLIKTKFPKARCILLKGRLKHYLVNLGDPDYRSVSVGKTPMQAWAKAYERLIQQGRLQ